MMSDPVLIALITGLSVAVPAIVSQGVVLVRLCAKMDRDKQDIRQITREEVARQIKANDEQINLMKTGAFRAGHVAGQEYAKASGFGAIDSKHGEP